MIDNHAAGPNLRTLDSAILAVGLTSFEILLAI